MRRSVASLILSFLVAGSGVAHGANGKHGSWSAVEGLDAGAQVEVQPQGQAGPDECRLSSVDDGALTCVAEGSVSGTRLVYPRGSVRNIWVIEPAPQRHIVLWVAIGASAALIAAASVGSGVIGGLFVSGVMIGIWTYCYESPYRPPPQPQRMRRRLVYRGATP